jgi:hypothetical protein
MTRGGGDGGPVVDALVLLADPAGAAGEPVPAGWSAVTTSWCLPDDPVCDAGSTDPIGGLLAHVQGYRSPAVLDPVARTVADQLGSS